MKETTGNYSYCDDAMAKCYDLIATVCIEKGQFHDAVRAYNYKIGHIRNQFEKQKCYARIAELYCTNIESSSPHNLQIAIEMYYKACEDNLTTNITEFFFVADCWKKIAEIHLLLKQYSQAVIAYTKAIQVYDMMKERKLVNNNDKAISEITNKLNDPCLIHELEEEPVRLLW
jgi:tetratricopeptide (TPR) repeat protein